MSQPQQAADATSANGNKLAAKQDKKKTIDQLLPQRNADSSGEDWGRDAKVELSNSSMVRVSDDTADAALVRLRPEQSPAISSTASSSTNLLASRNPSPKPSSSSPSSPIAKQHAQQQHAEQQQAQHQAQQQQLPGRPGLPRLNLSKISKGGAAPAVPAALVHVRTYSEDADSNGVDSEEEEERELARALHPNAPASDRRCYVYRPISLAEIRRFAELRLRLPEGEAHEVQAIWDALMTARHDCEVMAARGVRVVKDVSRDWQETVADLIDKVVATENDMALMKQQLERERAKRQQMAATGLPPEAALMIEDLQGQVAKLKRVRDKLLAENKELAGMRQAHGDMAAKYQDLKERAMAVYDKYQLAQQQASSLEEQRDELQHEVAQLRALLAHETGAAGGGTPRSARGGLIAHLRGIGSKAQPKDDKAQLLAAQAAAAACAAPDHCDSVDQSSPRKSARSFSRPPSVLKSLGLGSGLARKELGELQLDGIKSPLSFT